MSHLTNQYSSDYDWNDACFYIILSLFCKEIASDTNIQGGLIPHGSILKVNNPFN